jgi:hypothetical protein
VSGSGPRHLIYVPIIHDLADMGTKAQSLQQAFVGRFGREQWERRRNLIAEVWGGIRQKLLRRALPWDRVQIYQDGLPVSGRELDIAREVAAQGSQNYRLVLDLVARGATLMGTESPALLIREYQLISQVIEAHPGGQPGAAGPDASAQGQDLLRSRDEYIAHRIQDTLANGGIGVLFLGMMHQVDQRLAADIAVEFLIDRLPLWGVAEED